MIKEYAPDDIAEAVHESIIGDGAVIRGLVSVDQAQEIAKLVPTEGKRRAYLSSEVLRSSAVNIPDIIKHKNDINKVIVSKLGRSASIGGAYVMRPDMLRSGETKAHLDGRGAIVSGSLNLETGSHNEAVFFAHRSNPVDAPYTELEATWQQNSIPYEDMAQCAFGIGDMVIISRGVIHGCFAAKDRKAITYRTRGLIPNDFR